jgi:RNA polymerase sigma-70 factor (ECF subfamily)
VFTGKDTTALLAAIRQGDRDAEAQLLRVIYRELHRIASFYMRRERPDHTLQATALINEAYLKLIGCADVEWQNRAHFVAVAATVMRRILVEHARKHNAEARGGRFHKTDVTDVPDRQPTRNEELLALDQALSRLEHIEPRQARVVELRYFGGLSVEETAGVLGTSPRSVKRDWSLARIWLHRNLTQKAE